ncbi:MAG: VOC family protein [Gammaproteobacteria bacterium]|nr:VOC family protein [Gammaproteobacteria bacterium]
MSNKSVLKPNGINHLALATSNMKKTLQYFNRVLGMPLVSLYWMHGVEDTMHGFLALNEHSLLAFVGSPKIGKDIQYGHTHAGNPGGPCTGGTMQHVAFNVDSHKDLLALRDRIRSKGIHCVGPMDHGMMQSIYFAGPDAMTLEVTYMTGEDPTQWIDPEVVDLLEINEEELNELKTPVSFFQPDAAVPNPSMEAADKEYRMNFPPQRYQMMVNTPDEVLTQMTRDNLPPTYSTGEQVKGDSA